MLYMARMASNAAVAASMRSESSLFHGSYLMREAIRQAISGHQEAIRRHQRCSTYRWALRKKSQQHAIITQSA